MSRSDGERGLLQPFAACSELGLAREGARAWCGPCDLGRCPCFISDSGTGPGLSEGSFLSEWGPHQDGLCAFPTQKLPLHRGQSASAILTTTVSEGSQ